MNQILSDIALVLQQNLTRGSITTCSAWSRAYRVMGAPFPGPYSTQRFPWIKGILDCDAPYITFQKSAQCGASECAINKALFTLDIQRRDVLILQPTSGAASDSSRARFGPALSSSPHIQDMFVDTNSIGLKLTASGRALYIRGSRSESGLKSVPAALLIMDEVDAFNKRAMFLAHERLSGQTNKNVYALSTPTIRDYGVNELFQKSSQDHFFFVCGSCSKWIEMTFPDAIEIIGESNTDPRCSESYYKCPECSAQIRQEQKLELFQNAKWESTNSDGEPGTRGFYINQMYSSTITAEELVRHYLTGQWDEFARQEFYNSKLGLPFTSAGSQLTLDQVNDCVANYSKQDPRPVDGNRIITLGIDQGKTNYYVIKEFFIDGWINDINAVARARILDEGIFLENEWDQLDRLMKEWQVRAAVIDADPSPLEARRFARRFPGFVHLCRYRRGCTGREISIADVGDDAPIATVDRTNWLDCSLGRYRQQSIEIPRDASQMFRNHLTALARTYVRDDKGNVVAKYVSTSADHFAHADTYAEIALPLVGAQITNRDIASFL